MQYQLKDLSCAIMDFDEVLKEHRNCALALFNRGCYLVCSACQLFMLPTGTVYHMLGSGEMALKDYNACIDLAPQNHRYFIVHQFWS